MNTQAIADKQLIIELTDRGIFFKEEKEEYLRKLDAGFDNILKTFSRKNGYK